MERRSFLKYSSFAGAGFAGASLRPGTRDCPTLHPGGQDLVAMAADVLATGDVEKLALGWVARGSGFRDLLGAAYLAGIQEVNPSPIGGQVHAMMMVPSALTVAAGLRGRDKLTPAIFNLQRVKRSQGRDASNKDWRMPAAPPVEDRPQEELRRAFVKAMDRWNAGDADRAITSLHPSLGLDEFFELLWPFAARDFRIIGHKIIYATQTYRVLQDIGWRLGRDGVRSLVLGILDANPYGRFSDAESAHVLAVHGRNVVRCRSFPSKWALGPADHAASFVLLRELRTTDADDAAKAVLAALQRGVSGAAAWDGVRLCAFEMAMRHPNIAGMHGVTSVNALYRAACYTRVEATRRLMLLQAASWLPMFLPILAGRSGATDRRIDELKAGERSDPFASADAVVGGNRAFRLAGQDVGAFCAGARAMLARKAQHDHDYKFSVAAVEEIAEAHPALRPYLAGASMAMMRNSSSPDSPAWQVVHG